MDSEETEVLVIGAGPAGLIAAREVARQGAEVTVLEEHEQIGVPCHCAGLLSIKGMETIGAPPHGAYVQNKVKGATFFSPSGISFTVERKEPVACVVDRSILDNWLAKQATEAGAHIRLGQRVNAIKRVQGRIIGVTEKRQYEAKVVIDAEGIASRTLKALGLEPLKPACMLPATQFVLKGADVNMDYVEIHVGRHVAPGFFAWVIPLSEETARVGLACKGTNPKEQLQQFIRDRFKNSKKPEKVNTSSGVIITGGPIENTVDDGFLVVGDAAGQVKPTTGGGVILGGICAATAGKVAVEAVNADDFSELFLGRYENSWKNVLGKEFKSALFARRVLDQMPDKTVDKFFKAIIEENLQDELSAEGDMDFQRSVIIKILKRKEVLAVLPSLLRAVLPFK